MSPNPFKNVTSITGDALIVWSDKKGVPRTARPDRKTLAIDFHDVGLARQPARYQHRRNYEGHYWFAGTRKLVWHESMTEYTALMWLDHTQDIVGIGAQPMCMVFDDNTRHYPDYFAVHSDERRVIYNVKGRHHFDEKAQLQAAKAAEICERVGWGYVNIHDFSRVERHNLEWLAAYRHPRYRPTVDERQRILDVLTEPMSLDEASRILDFRTPVAHIHKLYNLMWERDALFDTSRPLSRTTRLWRPQP